MVSVFLCSFAKMDVKPTELYLCDYKQTDFMLLEENKLLKQLQAEVEMCCNNDRTEDEVTAAIGMMLMHYLPLSEAHFTPKNKPIVPVSSTKNTTQHPENLQLRTNDSNGLHGVQRHGDSKSQLRKNRKSNSSKSSLLASCRNILKEFLSQNSM